MEHGVHSLVSSGRPGPHLPQWQPPGFRNRLVSISNDATIKLANYNPPGYGSYWYKGGIDDVRVYDRVLAEADINVLFAEGGWDREGPSIGTSRHRKKISYGEGPMKYSKVVLAIFCLTLLLGSCQDISIIAPEAPTGVLATAGDGQVFITWT